MLMPDETTNFNHGVHGYVVMMTLEIEWKLELADSLIEHKSHFTGGYAVS